MRYLDARIGVTQCAGFAPRHSPRGKCENNQAMDYPWQGNRAFHPEMQFKILSLLAQLGNLGGIEIGVTGFEFRKILRLSHNQPRLIHADNLSPHMTNNTC